MYRQLYRPWALAALSALILMTACSETSTLPTDLDPQLAKGGGGPKNKPDPQDPRVLWKVATGGWIFGGAALDGGTLYFSSGSGRFYAVGVDGQVRWTLRADISGGSHGPPVVEAGTVYFTSLRHVYAVDAASGDVHWSRPLTQTEGKGKNKSGPYLAGLSVTGKWIHVGDSEGTLFALNKETGETVASVVVGPGQGVVTEPTFANGRLYVAARTSLGAVVHSFFVEEDGSLTQQSTSRDVGNVRTSLFHDGAETMYFTSRNGYFYAMRMDLTVRNRVQIDSDGSQAASSAAIGANGTIYVASYDTCFPTEGSGTTANACLYAIDPGNLSVQWTASIGTTVWNSSPAIGADGTIYIGNSDDLLVAIDAEGTELWTFQADNWVHGSPTILGGTLFVGSDDGSMYALETDADEDEGGLFNSPWPKLRADAANSGVAGSAN